MSKVSLTHFMFELLVTDDPKRDVGQKRGQPYTDEQVATYDCIERLKSYNYVAVIDVDEYIYPRHAKDHNLKALLVCFVHGSYIYGNTIPLSFSV